jgi:hypothetical protein
VVLLTDFGDTDPFVGQMKGMITGIAPSVQVIDLCHKVPPQRVDLASLFLEGSRIYFPVGTVFVAVIDPGVGTSRRPVMVNAHRQYFVGPDNGLFFNLVRAATWSAVQIENPKYLRPEISSTFHGRDVFAPAAAHLAVGVPMDSFGRKVSALLPLAVPKVRREGMVLKGEVVHIDSFGNAWTNIPKSLLMEIGAISRPDLLVTEINGKPIRGLSAAYHPVARAAVAVLNSFNLLEIAWPDGSAAEKLGLSKGTPVQVSVSG